MNPFEISYWIALHDDGDEYTPIQGFSRSITERAPLMWAILSELPPDIYELYAFNRSALQRRVAGLTPYSVLPLDAAHFVHIEPSPDSLFHVVLSNDATHTFVSKWAASTAYPPLIINVDSLLPNAPLLTRAALKNYCDTQIALVKAKNPDRPHAHFDTIRSYRPTAAIAPVSIDIYNHNSTLPNEVALQSVGCTVGKYLRPLNGLDLVYINAIKATADALAKLRGEIPDSPLFREFPPLLGLMITSPGILLQTRKWKKPAGVDGADFYSQVKKLQTQSTYAMIDRVESLEAMIEAPAFKLVMGVRAGEQRAFSAAISVRSSSYLTPTLRLPPSVDLTFQLAVNLSDSVRANRAKSQRKLRGLADKLSAGLASCVPAKFMEWLTEPHTHITLISDAPLEWLPVLDLPLMLRHPTSRIPATPGNRAVQEILPRAQLHISMEHFSEVLVLRSFKDDDPIRGDLQMMIDELPPINGQQLPVRFVDVTNRDDVVAALKNYSGAMLLLDCHGTHSRSSVGKLQLLREDIDFHTLRGEVRVPPIVMTCACDTFAIARDHSNIGSGLLGCGAYTVIATMLPVESRHAAIFASLLLFRIFKMLARITSEAGGAPRRWISLVSNVQRLMFVGELVRKLEYDRGGPAGWAEPVEVGIATAVETRHVDWYEAALESIAQESMLSVAEIEAFRREHLPFPEVLKYVQIGSPELIIIGSAGIIDQSESSATVTHDRTSTVEAGTSGGGGGPGIATNTPLSLAGELTPE